MTTIEAVREFHEHQRKEMLEREQNHFKQLPDESIINAIPVAIGQGKLEYAIRLNDELLRRGIHLQIKSYLY